jgi:hypothetical protein
MVQSKSFNLYPARTAGMLSGARRTATLLLVTLLLTMTAQTAWAEDFSAYGVVSETPTIDYNASNFQQDGFYILSKLFDNDFTTARTKNGQYNVSVVFYYDTPITPNILCGQVLTPIMSPKVGR